MTDLYTKDAPIGGGYVAWLAYRKSGDRMPEDVWEVDEDTLQLLDDQLRSTPAYDPNPAP